MAPFGGALFWGSAAKQTDESSREWERLWQQEQDRLSREETANTQLRQERQLAESRMAFEERLAQAERDFNEGLVDRNEQFEIGKEAIDKMAGMTLDQQWGTVETLERQGNPWAALARQNVRVGFFDDPQEAFDLVNSVFTAPLGTKFAPAFVNMAVDVVTSMSGMEKDAAEQLRNDVTSALEQRASEAEELDFTAMEGSRVALQQARANVVKTGAETGQTLAQTDALRAQTAQIYQNIDITEEQRGLHLQILQRTVDDMDATIRIKGLEATAQEIMNGYLPQQLTADLARSWAETRGLKDQHDLYTRTVEYTVRELAARTGLAEEDLNFAIATSMAREAMVDSNLDLLKANIALVNAQEAGVRANTGLTQTQTEAAQVGIDETKLRMNETRISMLSQLTANGDVELLQAGGVQLLRDMGMDDERAANVLRQLTEVASSHRSNAAKVEEANVVLALENADYARDTATARRRTAEAEADLKEFEAQSAPVRQAFEYWSTREGFRIQWEYVDIAQQNAATSAAAARGAAAAGTAAAQPLSLGDMINSVRTSSGIDQKEFLQLQSDLEAANNDVNYFQNLLNTGSVNEIADYLTSIGVSPDAHNAHLQNLIDQRDAAARALGGAMKVYLLQGMSDFGIPFSPDQLGVIGELGMEVYRQVAPSVIPGLREMSDEELAAQAENDEAKSQRIAEVWDDVYSMASTLSMGSAKTEEGGSVSVIIGASEMYNRLVATYGPERVAEAGIDPERLANDLGAQILEYQENVKNALMGLNLVTGNNPQQVDARSPEALNSAATLVTAQANGLSHLKGTIEGLPQRGAIADFFTANYSPEYQQAARSLVAMLEGLVGVDELVRQGVIAVDDNGQPTTLNRKRALALVDSFSTKLFDSAASIRWLAINGGIR